MIVVPKRKVGRHIFVLFALFVLFVLFVLFTSSSRIFQPLAAVQIINWIFFQYDPKEARLMFRRVSTRALNTRALSTNANDPISPSEFLDNLSRIWRPQEESGTATKIGMLSAGDLAPFLIAYGQVSASVVDPTLWHWHIFFSSSKRVTWEPNMIFEP